MKEPSVPQRHKRPPSVQKLKLVCSFNGSFRPRPPSGRLRYVGGESRIISIDRSAGISRLLSKISSLCPENRSLALKYQIPEPGHCSDREGPPLVSLVSDDDVHHMVEEYDRALLGATNARLRVFVISSENGYVGPYPASAYSSNVVNVNSSALPADNVFERKFPSTRRVGFCHLGDICGLNGSESKIATTQIGGVPGSVDPFCQMAYRPQILTTQMAGIQKAGAFLASDASNPGIGCVSTSLTQHCGYSSSQKMARHQILITNTTRNQNFATDSRNTNNLLPPKPIGYVSGARRSGCSRPLLESQSRYSSIRLSEGLAHERRFGSSNFNQMIGAVEFPHQIYDSKTVERACIDDLNRENISPWNVAYSETETCLAPVSHSSELARKAAPPKLLVRIDGITSNLSCRIRNHRIGVGNLRHDQIGLCDARGHRNGPHDNVNYRVCGFDLKPCYGKMNIRLRPRSDISKVGQTRSHQVRFLKAWHGALGHGGGGVPKMADSSKGTPYLLGHENEGKMTDWVGQLTARRLPVDPLSFQGGLHQTVVGISHFHKNGVQHHDFVWNGSTSCHMGNPSCSPYEEKQLQCSRATTIRKNITCNENHVIHATESNPSCGNYFGAFNQFLGAYKHGFNYTAISKPHCNDLSVELSPNAALNEVNVDPAVMQTYSVMNTQQNDVAVPSYSEDRGQNTCLKSMNNKLSPLDDQNTYLGLLSGMHEKASVIDFGRKLNGHHDETPLDSSMCNLSLLSLTEATVTSSSDDLECNGRDSSVSDQNNANGIETFGCKNASWGWKLETQRDETDPVGSCVGFLSKDRAEDRKYRGEDYRCLTVPSDASFKDSPETGSSLKPSRKSYQYELQKSCSMVKIFSNGQKNEQRAPSKPGMEEEAKGETFGCCSDVVDQPNSEFVRIYTCSATQELQTIQNSDLEEIRELGSGTYGTVFHGKWKGSDVAIKRIKACCFEGGELRKDRLIADFWREAHLLGQLHHPNVVAFYGVVKDGPAANLATVTEYMVNGSLKQVLQKKDRTIDRRKRLIIAMDAAFGMEYLHEKNIVHFDLKSHNFLVNMRDPQRPVCKIGDLGLSKVKQKTLVSGGVRGTIPWMAPELLTADKNTMVTEKIDVFSFGIVMWELLTGEEPHADKRSEEIIAGIIKGNLRPVIPSWCDPAWGSLMERCWSSDPASRPSFSEIAKELRSMSASMNIK